MAIKISVGGGSQIIPNAKEINQRILSLLPPKRYAHYFKLEYYPPLYAVFCIICTGSPSEAARNTVNFIQTYMSDGQPVPCWGAVAQSNAIYYIAQISLQDNGTDYKMDSFSTSVNSGGYTTSVSHKEVTYSSVATVRMSTWLYSIEI